MSPDRMKETDELEKVTLGRLRFLLLIGLSLPYQSITYSTRVYKVQEYSYPLMNI